MIVREILTEPKLIYGFDFFNDAKDTISWLRKCQTPAADAAARRLERAYKRWLKQKK